jgi:hypothetical protein
VRIIDKYPSDNIVGFKNSSAPSSLDVVVIIHHSHTPESRKRAHDFIHHKKVKVYFTGTNRVIFIFPPVSLTH